MHEIQCRIEEASGDPTARQPEEDSQGAFPVTGVPIPVPVPVEYMLQLLSCESDFLGKNVVRVLLPRCDSSCRGYESGAFSLLMDV